MLKRPFDGSPELPHQKRASTGIRVGPPLPPVPMMFDVFSQKSSRFGPDYEDHGFLSFGTYGVVWKVLHKPSGEERAIKMLKNFFNDQNRAFGITKQNLREIDLLSQLSHPNIVKLIDVAQPSPRSGPSSTFLVMEYIESNLKSKLLENSASLTLSQIKTIMYQLLLAISYCHDCGVVHRDLKPDNILIGPGNVLKLCDFGLSRGIVFKDVPVDCVSPPASLGATSSENSGASTSLESSWVTNPKLMSQPNFVATPVNIVNIFREMTHNVQTLCYRAPELLMAERNAIGSEGEPVYGTASYGPAVDMWSIGCIFAELLQMLEADSEPKFNPFRGRVLFDGACSACRDSPCACVAAKKGASNSLQHVHLGQILDVIGSPNDQLLNEMGASKYGIEAVKSLPKFAGNNFRSLFPGASDDALDLIQRMLRLHPGHYVSLAQRGQATNPAPSHHRITAADALNHPFFRDVQYPTKDLPIQDPKSVSVEIETCASNAQNFENILKRVVKTLDQRRVSELQP